MTPQAAANGTLMGGAAPVPGRVKGGLKLNGTGAYVQIPSAGPLNVDTGNFSLDAWVKIDNGPGPRNGFIFYIDKFKLLFYVGSREDPWHWSLVCCAPQVPRQRSIPLNLYD